ncbi:MAG: acyl-CoA thioesterase [Deltaproteobacteria bacterium]|nr:MAG: acyl-CoA thioesterase [Deltaproteobacteria bacterium]
MPFLFAVAVAPADIDDLGHASNLVYLRWVQEAARAHSTACGLGREDYLARGEAFVVRRHEIDYLRPAFAGDQLTVETRVAEMGRASSLRKTRILRGAEVLATAATDWAYIDLGRGRAIRIPEDVRARFPVEP